MQRQERDIEQHCDFWVLIQPAKHRPGQWLAHCLNLGVGSQGTSASQAKDTIREAVALTLGDDLRAGRNPLKRYSAPQDYWDQLRDVMTKGKPVLFSDPLPNAGSYAVMMGYEIRKRKARESEPPWLLPAWFLEA